MGVEMATSVRKASGQGETDAAVITLWNGETASAWLGRQVERGVLKPCRALVLSAEMTEEAVALSRLGFHVIVIDPDASALAGARDAGRTQGIDLDTVRGDLFRMKPNFFGPVELIFDRTFFHSLDPIRRAAWSHTVGRILPRGGALVGSFRIGRSEDGPPFPITLDALKDSFRNMFTTELMESAGTHRPGEDQVYFGLFRRN
jgi:hypothetical protein